MHDSVTCKRGSRYPDYPPVKSLTYEGESHQPYTEYCLPQQVVEETGVDIIIPLPVQGGGLGVRVIAANLGCELAVNQQRTQAKHHHVSKLQRMREGAAEMRLGIACKSGRAEAY